MLQQGHLCASCNSEHVQAYVRSKTTWDCSPCRSPPPSGRSLNKVYPLEYSVVLHSCIRWYLDSAGCVELTLLLLQLETSLDTGSTCRTAWTVAHPDASS